MPVEKRVIRIESILGCHAPTTHFAAPDQFRASLGIDPSLPATNDDDAYTSIASGLIRPVGVAKSSSSTVSAPLWIIGNPKATSAAVSYFVYDSQGSAYITQTSNPTPLSDGGALSSSGGNGCEYYDNFIYFAKNTDIARYGPLNAAVVPEWDGSYWVTTLSKTALVDTTYKSDGYAGIEYPNHILKRHSDGRLYIADVVGNQGTIHFIQTTKTTYEGDTDNGSTYNKVQVGFGLWPTAMESYGSDLAIAFHEDELSAAGSANKQRAKLAFWDTTSTNINKITWVEFPDPLITALKNVDGVLYVVSGNNQNEGFRISRFVGGYTVEEVGYFETGQAPHAGAVDGRGNQLIFGSYTTVPEEASCVYGLGLQKKALGNGLFNLARAATAEVGIAVTALAYEGGNLNQDGFFFYTNSGATGNGYRPYQGSLSTAGPPVWWSQLFRIGQRFKITKLRILLTRALTSATSVVPTIYTDDGATSTALTTIVSTNYSNGERAIVIRPENLTGWWNFWLELKWNGTTTFTVGLPVTIEYELLED